MMFRYLNFILAGVTVVLFMIFFLQVESTHSLWTDSEGQIVRMQLSLFSCTLTSDVKTGTYYNFGAVSLMLFLITSLVSAVRKK